MKNTKVLILSILFLSLFSNCGLFDSGSSKKSSNYAGLSNSNTDSGGNTNEDNSATAAADPVFSPDGGSFSSSQNVSITTSTPGAVIYYTSTGVDPTCSGLEAQYSTPISVTATETIKAIACKTNLDDSAVVSETYTITTPAGTVVAPTMTPGTGSYTSAQTVSISTPTSGAVIHYALGGTVPTCSTGTPYTTALTVSSNGTVIKAIACKSGVMVDSSVTTATYYLAVATPSINPGQGTYPTTQTVTISAVTPSSVVHYTIGGSTPTCSSGTGVTTAQAVVSVTGTVIKAVGCKSGMVDSNIASATYILSSSTPCTANNFSPSGYTPCSACSSDQYSTGVSTLTSGSTSCLCDSGYLWNTGMCRSCTTAQCPANTWSTTGYQNTSCSCTACSSMPGSTGASTDGNTLHTTGSTQCACDSTHVWKASTHQCVACGGAGQTCCSNSWCDTSDEDLVCNSGVCHPSCFKEGTKVQTPNGDVNIEKIKAGDSVYSYSEKAKKLVVSKVKELLIHKNFKDPAVVLVLENGIKLDVTKSHRFYSPKDKKYHKLGKFKVGDKVLLYKDSVAKEVLIKSMEPQEPFPVSYNLELEDGPHNYLVEGIIVHNQK